MTEANDNLVLEPLRRIRASQERTEIELHDIKARMSAVEGHAGATQVQLGAISMRLDRLDERVARIEKRLDLVEA